MLRGRIVLSLWAGVIMFGCAATSLAQTKNVAEEKTFGDWILYEDRDFDQDPLPSPKGIVDLARTTALNGHDVSLGFKCSTYSVGYFLYEDKAFSDAMSGVDESPDEKPLYIQTNKQDSLFKALSSGGYSTRSFEMSTEALIKAGTLMICPTRDEKGPACLSFSLKGFTAALKALCPKR